MTVLITGADGFVGSALRERLLSDSVAIRAAIRTKSPDIDEDQCVAMGDISTKTDWTLALEGVRQVVHLAGRVDVMKDYLVDPLVDFRLVNVEATASLARQAAAAGAKRFIYLSSIKVNGEFSLENKPFTTSDVPDPKDPYSISKFEAELLLRKISKETGIEVVVLRPPLVYGPGVRGNFLRLLRAHDKNRLLPFGSIKNKRSFIYLGNLIDIICVCLNHPKAAGEVFLVSDGDDISTAELSRRIASALGRNALLMPVPAGWIELGGRILGKETTVWRLLTSLCADISHVQKQLGWEPPFAMQAGLRATVDWYRKNKQGIR